MENNRGFISWGVFLEMRAEHNKKVHDTVSKLLNLEPIPQYGDIFTLDEFVKCVEDGSFMDHDGSGNYATETGMSNKDVYPSDIKSGNIDRKWTHVVWFNK